jgi:glycyl-tRNA synthetase beta chain
MSKHTVLFELGCEELPPKSLKTLRDALKQEVSTRLAAIGLHAEQVLAYAAPRRLAIVLNNIDAQQADRTEEKRGPAAVAAFDAEGKPTKALEGFMRGAGITVDQLERIDTPKGEWLVYRKTLQGQPLESLLPALLQDALNALPIAKRMRSAASRTEFVRPVQWVVLMKDDQIIPATIQDFAASNISYGHRFHAPQAITISHASHYLEQLRAAYVLADFDQRQAVINQQVQHLAAEVDAVALMPEALLDEVTGLVEWPVALRATFEARFLHVPQEALISTMQDNQKYFCLVDHAGKLQPYFITVSNIESKDPAQIIDGNEKVVRPRLTDAEFFFKQDQKQPLFARQVKLQNMIFQAQLGTLWDKAERVANLAAFIATQVGSDIEQTTRAALLAKMDLATELVGEFPELQGIAGSYYAKLEGEPHEVSEAIREQYLPRFAGDVLPQTQAGFAVALADRLDTLAGIFGINQAPTGSKDPFSLRRAAIGILRLLIEKQIALPLTALVGMAVKGYGNKIKDGMKTLTDASEFLQGRYRAMYEDQGIAVDTILAVQALSPDSPLDFDRRIRAVEHFRRLPEAAALAAANKRVANILAKEADQASIAASTVDAGLLVEAAERALFAQLEALEPVVQPLLAARDYTPALSKLAALRESVDQFFDQVMVNADDAALKLNRLRLLARLRGLFMSVADVSVLQG